MQAEAGSQYGLTQAQQQQEYSDINAGTTAAVNQDSKQIANAAGRSLLAQNAPLTDNLQLSDPEVQLQNITVDLNSVPLPSVPSFESATSAPANDTFTRYWNDSVAQLTGGPSPSFAAAFDQMLATGTQSPVPAESLTPAEISNENAKSLLAFSPYPYVEGIANSGLRALGDVAQYFGASGVASWLDSKQLPTPPLLQSMAQSAGSYVDPYLQEAQTGLVNYLGPDRAAGLEHLAGFGLDMAGVVYGVGGLTGEIGTVGSDLTTSLRSTTLDTLNASPSITLAGSPGRIYNSGAPLSAQLGQLDLSGLVPGSAPAITSTGVGGASDYGVAFFGSSNLGYYTRTGATLGTPDKSFFLMPLEDSGVVTDAASAARYTGMSPSTLDAYANGGDIYGISFPTNGYAPSTPTAADAGGWPHFLEGGNTAVLTGTGPNAGYLVNPTREFVIPGGSAVPSGSVLFQLASNGEWIPLKKF